MNRDEFLALITSYTDACDDLGAGLFDQPQAETDAKYAVAKALWERIVAETERMIAEIARFERELRNISEAKRFDRSAFEDDSCFAAWAQSRARHSLSGGAAT